MRRSNRLVWALGLAVVASIGLGTVYSCSSDPSIGEAEATAIAARYLGIENLAGVQVSADQVEVQGDKTPFIHELIEGRRCYQVVFRNLDIRIPSGSDVEVVVPVCTLNALVDAESGKLLKVWSAERLASLSENRSIAEKERALAGMGPVTWEGLPDGPPRVALLEALRRARFYPVMEQLDAFYVTRKGRQFGDPRPPEASDCGPAWVVILRSKRGSLDSFSYPEQETPYPVWGWRMDFDGETGEILVNTNAY